MLAFIESFSEQGWQSIAVVGALGLGAILAVVSYRLRGQKRRLTAAIEHMSQGLCVYDGKERMRLFNQRYVEMYVFPPDVVKQGATLRDILAYRIAQGTLSGNAEEYRKISWRRCGRARPPAT
jgi:methyl-accepting chemotaxis protein